MHHQNLLDYNIQMLTTFQDLFHTVKILMYSMISYTVLSEIISANLVGPRTLLGL